MHNSLRITECPHCNTAFRVSDAQLRAAKGAVRCGSCLEIFLANQHWLHDDNTDELDDWSDDDPDTMLAELEQLDRELESSIDESWALKLLEEEQDHLTSTSYITDTNNQPTFVVLNDDNANKNIVEDIYQENNDADNIIDDEPLTFSNDGLNTSDSQINNQHSAVDNDDLFTDDDEFAREQAMFAGDRFNNNQHPDNQFERNFDLDDAESDFAASNQHAAQAKKKTFPEWISALVLIIAAIFLAAQYIYYHAAELSQNAEWRWLTENACPILQCNVPEWRDLQSIQHDNLVVRSHPIQKDALLVNVRLINNSPFAQAFPLMELRFSDINGNEIASRRFKPEEYLAGELSGLKQMPVRQAIQIELGIVDPGSQAVNYQLGLLPDN